MESYQLNDEEPAHTPWQVTHSELIAFTFAKTNVSLEDLVQKETVKLNIKMYEFLEWFQKPVNATPQAEATSSSEHLSSVAAQLLQTQFMTTPTKAVKMYKHRGEQIVKPDLYDCETSAAEAWLGFYEYACENSWVEGTERIKNLCFFLAGNANKWSKLWVREHECDLRDSWKWSFTTSFEVNDVKHWDKAVFYKP